jgi:hypothetical protein
MTANQEQLQETVMLFEQCSAENLMNVININKILVNLSASQLEYLLELSTLLFCQSPK